MHFQEETIDDLMMSVYSALLASGKANEATKGKTIELLGCNLVLSNPRARISSSESRGKIFSCLGELLWYLSGTGDTEFIKYYIKNMFPVQRKMVKSMVHMAPEYSTCMINMTNSQIS